MAVAVSILVALVTACVSVGPPRAELAACETSQPSDAKEVRSLGLFRSCRAAAPGVSNTYLESLITISNKLLVQRDRILQEE